MGFGILVGGLMVGVGLFRQNWVMFNFNTIYITIAVGHGLSLSPMVMAIINWTLVVLSALEARVALQIQICLASMVSVAPFAAMLRGLPILLGRKCRRWRSGGFHWLLRASGHPSRLAGRPSSLAGHPNSQQFVGPPLGHPNCPSGLQNWRQLLSPPLGRPAGQSLHLPGIVSEIKDVHRWVSRPCQSEGRKPN